MEQDDHHLLGMLHHPDLIAEYDPEQLCDLSEAVLLLSQYGEVTLGSHDDRDHSTLRIEWSATLRLRSGGSPLMAHGPSPLLAVLRCLMEALSEVRRQARKAAEQIQDDLDSH